MNWRRLMVFCIRRSAAALARGRPFGPGMQQQLRRIVSVAGNRAAGFHSYAQRSSSASVLPIAFAGSSATRLAPKPPAWPQPAGGVRRRRAAGASRSALNVCRHWNVHVPGPWRGRRARAGCCHLCTTIRRNTPVRAASTPLAQ